MKTLFLFFAIVAATQASPAWENFKLEHKKVYANSVEERARFAIFQQNLKDIEEHNKLFQQGLVSWEKGVNQFTDMTTEEFFGYLKLSGPLGEIPNAKPYVMKSTKDPVTRINWVEQGKVTPVKDQGSCGSCWAFSTTGSIESQLLIKGKKALLSEQQLVDCSTANNGCSGGWINKAFEYIITHGIESEQNYNYTGKNGDCDFDRSKVVAKLRGYWSRNGYYAIENFVATEGPTSVYVDASDFQSYKSGIFDHPKYCSNTTYNHAVLLAGYDSENGKDYWLVKNSWGISWGEQGYIRILRHQNICNIEGYGFVPVIDE